MKESMAVDVETCWMAMIVFLSHFIQEAIMSKTTIYGKQG